MVSGTPNCTHYILWGRFWSSIISFSLCDDAPYVLTCLPSLARTLIVYLASVDILHPSSINHTDAHTSAGYDPEASDDMNLTV